MRFYRRDVNSVKKMIDTLEKYPHKEDSSFSFCRRAICGIYENKCRNCMFSSYNNNQQVGCGGTIGSFEEDSIYYIIANLKKVLYQIEYKKFKRVMRER